MISARPMDFDVSKQANQRQQFQTSPAARVQCWVHLYSKVRQGLKSVEFKFLEVCEGTESGINFHLIDRLHGNARAIRNLVRPTWPKS
jgi:hypothetical protein